MIVEEVDRFAGAFDVVICPVCGSCAWVEMRHEGTFCDDCNTKATLRATCGDRGFVVDFDSANTWDTFDVHAIPADQDRESIAYAKYMGTPEDGYFRAYLGVYAVQDGSADRSEWSPAWDREQALVPAE